jgi:4-oxalocrotonate tautomerase
MPLVRIDLRKGKSAEYVRAIGEALRRAPVEVLGAAARDNFQVIPEYDADHLLYSPDYLDIGRSDDIIFVQITLLAGRDAAKKQAFYARVVELLKEKPKVRPEDVVVTGRLVIQKRRWAVPGAAAGQMEVGRVWLGQDNVRRE